MRTTSGNKELPSVGEQRSITSTGSCNAGARRWPKSGTRSFLMMFAGEFSPTGTTNILLSAGPRVS